MGGLVGGLVGIGTSIAGGIIGANAARRAAQLQAQASTEAANYAQTQGQAATAAQNLATQRQIAGAQPYQTAGAGAVGQLSSMMAPGGQLATGYGQTFQAPTEAEARATPGYQFAFNQGQQALQRSAAAQGGALSGGALKAAMQYGTGLADQTYSNRFNQALQTFGTNRDIFYQNQQNLANRLFGLSGLGAQTTGQLNAVLQAGAGNIGRIGEWQSGQYGQDVTNRGTALASGQIGAAGAWQNALSGIGKAAGGLSFGGSGGGINPATSYVASMPSGNTNLSDYMSLWNEPGAVAPPG